MRRTSPRAGRRAAGPPRNALSAEAVQGAALALERVHDVHGRDGLPARVLGVGDRVADDVLEEDLEDAAGLLVDEAADALDAAAAGEAADGGLGDALDVVAEDLREEWEGEGVSGEEGGSGGRDRGGGGFKPGRDRWGSLLPCGGAWRRPCRGPCRPCRVQTWLMGGWWGVGWWR